MIQLQESINNKKTWRIFMINISLIIVLFLTGIFFGFVLRTNQIIREQITTTARSYFENIILARRWNADHGGVYVAKVQGVSSNPYLENPDILTTDGKVYTKKNPALMTREISEYAEREADGFTYHMTSLNPLNPNNAPDDFEKKSLKMFETGIKDTSLTEMRSGKTIFRYMAPLFVEKGCLECHAKQGYSIGEVRGGISISFDISKVKKEMKINKIMVSILSIFTVLILLTIIFMMVSRLAKKLTVAYQTIADMAITDELTQIYNRRHFHSCLDQEISRSKRYGHSISLIMLDIDHFKRVNDTYGHQIGDDVIAGIASIVKTTIRNGDIGARYGGEEIAVILPETEINGAIVCAEKIRRKIEEKVFKTINKNSLHVTASFGVTSLQNLSGVEKEEANKLIKMADDALYQAKNSGRNRVVKK